MNFRIIWKDGDKLCELVIPKTGSLKRSIMNYDKENDTDYFKRIIEPRLATKVEMMRVVE